MNQQKLNKWNRWIGDANSNGSIHNDLINLSVIREVHAGLIQMADENEALQKQSAFYSASQAMYSQTVLMYIRRQVRKDNDSVGLIMLAEDIHKNSPSITKEFHSNLYIKNKNNNEDIDFMKRLGEREFEDHFGGIIGNHLDPKIIQGDIDKLVQIFRDSSSYTDKRLAHLDHREPSNIPVLSDIESWCNTLNEVLRKYILLLQAVDCKIELVLEHDWKGIFRSAWL